MHLRYGPSIPFLVLGLSLAALPALAGKPLPEARPLAAAPNGAASGPCALGVTDPPAYSIGYIAPPDDAYYTLIDPGACECAGSGAVMASIAHVVIDAWDLPPWPVRVGVVQADLSNPDCPVPLPGQYLCPPVDFEIAPTEYGVYDAAIPLNASCLISGKAFLEVTFAEWGPWWTVPGLVTTGSCEPCRSYNYYPGAGYDLCTFGLDGNPVMHVETECSDVVPTQAESWGGVKGLYR